MKRYHPDQFVEFIEKYKITETTMVNPIIFNLLALPASKQLALQSLRFIWCGGVALPASVQNNLSNVLHKNAIVAQVWGMTEYGWITTLQYPERDNTGAVGRLLPNTEAR